MASVRIVSAGTGKSVDVPDSLTVAELREIADISDDIKLAFNGSVVENEDDTCLCNGDVIVATPKKIGHGVS